MIQLIKLELKKIKLGWYAKGAIIANILIATLMVFIGFVEKSAGGAPFKDYEEATIVMGALVRAVFIIFASVLIAKLVIEEYKNKTMTVMFTYPINRKKLLTAKLAIVSGLTFVTTLLSNVFVVFVFFSFNNHFQFISGQPSLEFFIEQSMIAFIFALAITGTSLIPLYFGMRNYSVPATIISSIIIVLLTSSHNPSISVASIIYIPLFLAGIGLIIAYGTIRKLDHEDVL